VKNSEEDSRTECIHVATREADEKHPRVELRFAEVDGRLACVSIEVGAEYLEPVATNSPLMGSFHLPAGEEFTRLTTAVLRTIKLSTLIDEALLLHHKDMSRWHPAEEQQRDWPDEVRASMPAGVAYHERRVRQHNERVRRLKREQQVVQDTVDTPKRPGRPRLHLDAHYEELAEVYNAHGGSAPLKAVVEHFDKRLTRTMAAKHVAEARRRGLIPKYQKRGGAGG